MRPAFSKNVGFHKIRRAAGFWSQNAKSSVNDFLKPGNEKCFFMKSGLIYCEIHQQSALLMNNSGLDNPFAVIFVIVGELGSNMSSTV